MQAEDISLLDHLVLRLQNVKASNPFSLAMLDDLLLYCAGQRNDTGDNRTF